MIIISFFLNTNFINETQFQFRSRNVYFDNTKSVLSPISNIAFVRNCNGAVGRTNCIEITFNETPYDNDEMSILKNVELFFREGNLGDWKFITSLNREDYFSGKFTFYNNAVYQIIPDLEANKLFDSIPQKANALSIIKNRLFLGGITEGRDKM